MRQRASSAPLQPRTTASRAPSGAAALDVPHLGRPNLKGWLSWDGDFLVGPRYIRLLEGVERTGTIREACRGTGLSYRTCLERLRRMEHTLGAPRSRRSPVSSWTSTACGARTWSSRASRRSSGRRAASSWRPKRRDELEALLIVRRRRTALTRGRSR